MAIFIGRDCVQLSDVEHEFQIRQWIESGTERYVYRSTEGSIIEEDGADLSSR
jgi:hypothetical protein